MTGFSPRGVALAAAALSFGGGLTACTADPRYPIVDGAAPGVGFAQLQPRYPTRLAAEAAAPDPTSVAAPAPVPPPVRPEIAPRAAPAGEVASAELAPPPGLGRSAYPPTAPATEAPAAAPYTSPQDEAAAPPPQAAAPTPAPAPAVSRAYLQPGPGATPPRFTIGAPVPPPSVAARPSPPSPLPTYARPSTSVPVYARPPTPVPTYARPPLSTPSYAGTGSTPPSYPARGVSTGLRPYISAFPQRGPRPLRSAGIASTPSAPGIAPRPLTVPFSETGPAPSPTQIAALGRGRFLWPLQGPLISGFGDKGTGQGNDGVDIAAPAGAAVRASAAGEVVYAGDQIPGSGNLVLVKHPGGWVTAYAHLSRINVRMREPVAQGQELGLAGQSGGVDRPQLHFEIRYAPTPEQKAKAVDPTTILPGG